VAIHFFENGLEGVIPDSFGDLSSLYHLSIFNDGREHEGVDNPNKNTIYLYNDYAIGRLTALEELNLNYLAMTGVVGNGIASLSKLQYFNLAHNNMEGSLPSVAWPSSLKYILLQENAFSGSLPASWTTGLPYLEYLDISKN